MSVEHGVPSAVGFVAVVGPPAVGKSTVSGALADRFGARVFRLREFAHEFRTRSGVNQRLFDTGDPHRPACSTAEDPDRCASCDGNGWQDWRQAGVGPASPVRTTWVRTARRSALEAVRAGLVARKRGSRDGMGRRAVTAHVEQVGLRRPEEQRLRERLGLRSRRRSRQRPAGARRPPTSARNSGKHGCLSMDGNSASLPRRAHARSRDRAKSGSALASR